MRVNRLLAAAGTILLLIGTPSSGQSFRGYSPPLVDPLNPYSPPRSAWTRPPAPIVSSRQIYAARPQRPVVKAPSVRHEYYPTRARGFSPNRNVAPSFARSRSPLASPTFFPGPMNGPLPQRLVPLPPNIRPRPRAGSAGEAFTR